MSTATAAEYDLCVRGASLQETRTARLRLVVQGADVARFAPRLGAVLVNRRFWDGRFDELHGAPFDEELCGEAVAAPLRLEITLTAEQANELEAQATRGAGTALGETLARLFGEPPKPSPPAPVMPSDAASGAGSEAVHDAAGNLLYRVVRVFYATNRKPTASTAPEARFGGERGPLSFGAVEVTLPKSHRLGMLEGPSILRLEFKASPDRHVTLKSLEVLDENQWRAQLRKRAVELGNAGILVFTHGYNSSFADAAQRAGQLSYDLGFGGATVLFSWPSRGGFIDYTIDEQSAEWSIPDMKAVLASLATLAPGTPIYLVAHSMGNRVLTRGFRALLDEDRGKRRAFREMILAAPDIDADVFKREIAPAILGRAPRVTLYASSNDKALVASRGVHGGYRRLGESGGDIVVLPDMDTVDASSVRTEFLGHSYFGDSSSVVSDLIYVIRRSLPPQERTQFFLEAAPSAVGAYWRFKSLK